MFIRFKLANLRPYIARDEEIESYGVTPSASDTEVCVVRFRSGREITVAHTLEELTAMIGEKIFYYLGDENTAVVDLMKSVNEFRAKGHNEIWVGVKKKNQ